MLLGYGDVVPQAMVDAEVFYYVEQDTTEKAQQAQGTAQETTEELPDVETVSDEELAILF